MSAPKLKPEDRPHWERTDAENEALFNAALDSGDAFPDPMPGADRETRRKALDAMLQVGIDELDRGEGITFNKREEMTAFFDEVMVDVRRNVAAARQDG